jgi:hypothetical protein
MRKSGIVAFGVAGGLLLLAITGWFVYLHQHRMAFAHAFETGEPTAPRRVLIATQGSAFKDALVAGIVEYLKPRAAYVQVMDVSGLPNIRPGDWTAIILIHTWEFGKPQADARAFADRVHDRNRLIIVTTSGNGREKLGGVDTISGASVVRDVPARLAQITIRLNALLEQRESPQP